MAFAREEFADIVHRLAARGVYVGTSSWKYPGWLGRIYTATRYEYRGRFAESRFNRDCLKEYAETFRTVSVDAAYYTFPTEKYLTGLAAQVPDGFLFGFKITDAITMKKFPKLARFGERAGLLNADFLNADLFAQSFLKPCETIRPKVGLLMFEFSRFWPSDYGHGRDFITDLDRFLGQLPKGWPYGVELRNRHWLRPDYFGCLARHGVTHVYNNWTDMPTVGEQMELPGSVTNPELTAARFLLKQGRTFEEAVKTFEPYDRNREVNDGGREAGARLMFQDIRGKAFVYVNNRFEGTAPETIQAMFEILKARFPAFFR